MNLLSKKKSNTYYNIGLIFISLSFISLLLQKFIFYQNIKIPKLFLSLYLIGALFLVLKNIIENNKFIIMNELLGVIISLILLIL